MSTGAHPPIDQQITFLYAEDPAATWDFYERTLGLELALDQGPCRIYRTAPNGFVGVCGVREGRESEPRGVVFTIVTPDVDGWYRKLTALGVATEGPPEASETFRVYCFFARDPNGYRIEFQRFLDDAWSGGKHAGMDSQAD